EGNFGPQQLDQAKAAASHYHKLLRSFANTYPDTSVSKLQLALLNVANENLRNSSMRQFAAQAISARIFGLRSELGFGQLLDAAGRQHRDPTEEEDSHGADHVLLVGKNGDRREVYLDIKATLKEIEGSTPDSVYQVEVPNKIKMFSLLR